MVSPEERDCYFYTKSIRALSELSFERLPAMCWTRLKISGNPVFKTPGRHVGYRKTRCCALGKKSLHKISKVEIFEKKSKNF